MFQAQRLCQHLAWKDQWNADTEGSSRSSRLSFPLSRQLPFWIGSQDQKDCRRQIGTCSRR